MNLKEWFIEAPWGKIALVSWGCEQGARVLAVHGRQCSSAAFLPLAALLPPDRHYVALDLPGHGRSDPFPIGVVLSRIDFVAPVHIVVQHLKWKSFVYLSHSMGGEIGLFYNAAFPDVIKKFIHLDVGLSFHSITQTSFKNYYDAYENYYDNYNEINVDDRVYTLESAVEAVQAARGLSGEQAALVLSRSLHALPARAPPPYVPHQEPVRPPAEFRLSWDKRLKNLVHLNLPYEHLLYLFTTNIPPTLFIAAADSIKNYHNMAADRLIQEMIKRVKDFKYKVVEGSHDVHLTNPERIADDIIDFLKPEAKSKL